MSSAYLNKPLRFKCARDAFTVAYVEGTTRGNAYLERKAQERRDNIVHRDRYYERMNFLAGEITRRELPEDPEPS